MKVAVCDDEPQWLARITAAVEGFAGQAKVCIEVSAFQSASELFGAAAAAKFDAVLLDISMPEINGIDLAKKIRRLDSAVQIAFVTFMESEVMNVFDVQPSGFVVKTRLAESLKKTLASMFEIHRQLQRQPYPIRQKGNKMGSVQLQDVLYFESQLHGIKVISMSSTAEFVGKISEEAIKLRMFGFSQIHRAYIVNLARVWIANKLEATFTNNVKLPVGSKFRDKFLEDFNSHAKSGAES